MPQPFIVIATQNPVGSAGTQVLPPAQLDRFMIRLTMGYPDFESQVNILRDRQTANPLDTLHPVTNAAELTAMKRQTDEIFVADSIYEYITRLAQASRSHPAIQLGLSPRAALAVCRMAKARAFVMGRDYVVPEDVSYVFPEVGSHRLLLSSKARLAERSAADLLAEILEKTAAPVSGSSGRGSRR